MLYFCCFQKKKEINKDKYKDIRLERIKILPFYHEKRPKIIENYYNK
jgi:hypothetical protein